MALTKKANPALKKTAGKSDSGAAPAEDEDETEGEGEGAAAAAPGTKTKVKVTAKADAKPNEELIGLFESYDEHVAAAEKAFVEMVEFIQENQIDRATVIASMMKARSLSFESAQKEYGTMKKIFNNEEVLQELKDGKITMRVARQKTKTTQKNPKSAKPEAKEQKFNATLKSFVAAAKESGFSRAEILTTVTAELKAAEIK